jgi:hypothetical protein
MSLAWLGFLSGEWTKRRYGLQSRKLSYQSTRWWIVYSSASQREDRVLMYNKNLVFTATYYLSCSPFWSSFPFSYRRNMNLQYYCHRLLRFFNSTNTSNCTISDPRGHMLTSWLWDFACSFLITPLTDHPPCLPRIIHLVSTAHLVCLHGSFALSPRFI